jgi:hypothetical protein
MNPAAAGAQEDESTLSSNDTNPVKLRWSMMKAEKKMPHSGGNFTKDLAYMETYW